MLPFRYALRNLTRRRARTLLTLGGVALIAFLVTLMAGFARGLDDSVTGSASEDVAVVVGASGETDLIRSFLGYGAAQQVAQGAPGVAEVGGERAASIELHVASRIGDRIGLVRGVTPGAYLVHPAVVVVEGTEPRGSYEVMVGRLAAARMGLDDRDLAVGRTIRLEQRDWTVSGRFAAPGTVLEAEIWGRLEDVMQATRRIDVSCVALRLKDPSGFPRLHLYTTQNVRLEATAVPETRIYGALRRAIGPVASLAWMMAALVFAGGVFGCANTMFAAVLARTREMGALRAVGYGPTAVAVSLVQESLLIGLCGGALAFVAASLAGEVPLRFPLGAFYLDLGSGVRFFGLAAALAAGLLGGIVPAVRAVRLPLPDALGGKL
ncbi:MAG TPA: ABC transporter permease [Planctomycetota bacterium]|nr:ABC transporter permease [Planctomycetota bacterium]